MERIAVLSSGGLDSCVLLSEEAKTSEVYPIYVRCGLAWEEMERRALERFLQALNNPHVRPVTTLSVSVEAMYGAHWSISGNAVPGAEESDSAVYLPGRNILLLGLAAIWCSTHDVSRIAIGSLGGNPFPDASPKFFSDFASALSLGLNRPIDGRGLRGGISVLGETGYEMRPSRVSIVGWLLQAHNPEGVIFPP